MEDLINTFSSLSLQENNVIKIQKWYKTKFSIKKENIRKSFNKRYKKIRFFTY